MSNTLVLENGKMRTADIQASRATIMLTNNGVLGDNAWMPWVNGVPTNASPIVIPWNCRLVEIAFSNNRTSVDGNFEFYLNGSAPGDIFRTWNFNNVNLVQTLTGISDAFTAGDLIRIQWDDQGQNPRDIAFVLFFVLDS